MSAYVLSNEPSHAPTHAYMLSRIEARTVYKYNETCPPHNITLLLARDID